MQISMQRPCDNVANLSSRTAFDINKLFSITFIIVTLPYQFYTPYHVQNQSRLCVQCMLEYDNLS